MFGLIFVSLLFSAFCFLFGCFNFFPVPADKKKQWTIKFKIHLHHHHNQIGNEIGKGEKGCALSSRKWVERGGCEKSIFGKL